MDITEETQARTALAQANQRQVAAQLTSGMAHDFANLLTVIMGLQGKLSRMTLPNEAHDLVGAIQVAAKRGGALLDQIAGLSAERHIRPKPTDLGAWLEEIALLARPSLPEDVDLQVNVAQTEPVLLDPDAMRDAVLNLILNARDAIGPKGRIEISAQLVRDIWIDLRIQDTGPGFSAEAMDNALTPFFTTKGDAGTGLGLSMVYDVVKLAGGRVTLDRAKIGGAEVRLRLPLRKARGGLAPTMILLVEDAAHIREALREELVSGGHSVVEAATVDEARALMDLPGIGLVLTDIMLKNAQSGVDLALEAAQKDLRTVMMTSLPPDAPLFQAAASVGPVLRKPVSLSDLEAAP